MRKSNILDQRSRARNCARRRPKRKGVYFGGKPQGSQPVQPIRGDLRV